MKTAISIPDPIFHKAERVAHKLAMSRSELYTQAIEAFVALCDDDEITKRLNEVYQQESGTLDPQLAKMQAATLSRRRW